MKLFNSTNRWVRWWEKRKIDWRKEYLNPDHPHRLMLVEVLKRLPFLSLLEVGCAAGANLVAIAKAGMGVQVAGVDVNPEAVAFARSQFNNALFKVNAADNLMLSDQSTDIILSDMTMIYISPFKIGRHLKEFKKVARNFVVLCELHSESPWERLVVKWKEGYNVFDWKKLLEKHDFYDVKIFKIPPEAWPESDLQQKYGCIIVARTPKFIR